jgi:hypothetical protein
MDIKTEDSPSFKSNAQVKRTPYRCQAIERRFGRSSVRRKNQFSMPSSRRNLTIPQKLSYRKPYLPVRKDKLYIIYIPSKEY